MVAQSLGDFWRVRRSGRIIFDLNQTQCERGDDLQTKTATPRPSVPWPHEMRPSCSLWSWWLCRLPGCAPSELAASWREGCSSNPSGFAGLPFLRCLVISLRGRPLSDPTTRESLDLLVDQLSRCQLGRPSQKRSGPNRFGQGRLRPPSYPRMMLRAEESYSRHWNQ